MSSNGRTTGGRSRAVRDLERLAGQRGSGDKAAIRWEDLAQVAEKLTNSTFGNSLAKYVGEGLTAADVERAVASSDTVRGINQQIDSTTTYITNLVDGYTGTLSSLDEEIAAANDTISDVAAQATAANDALETSLQASIDGVAADLSQNYYTAVGTDAAHCLTRNLALFADR